MLLGRTALGTCAYMGGIPAVLEPFCWSWGQMVQFNAERFLDDKHYIHYDRATISDHAPARNQLASRFLGSFVLMLDCDHQFSPDLLDRLLRIANEIDADVLSGVYLLKNPPHLPVLYEWVDLNGSEALQPLATFPPECEVLQIGSAGGGCLLVRRRVFERMADELHEGPFDRIKPYSEDHSFFVRCRRLGIPCWAALKVECHHLRTAPLAVADQDWSGLMVSEPFEVGGFSRA